MGDKVSAEEGSNAFFFLDIVGDPIPTVTWFKCSKDLATEPRCKSWTNGPGQVILGFQKVKQEDEGEYRCEIENEHGMQEHLFSLYVTVAGGMDRGACGQTSQDGYSGRGAVPSQVECQGEESKVVHEESGMLQRSKVWIRK